MHLFIANATRQIQDIHYRIPESTQARQQKIPIGGQIKIDGDLNQPAISSIVEQLSKYGMIAANDVKSSRAFAPMCYSVDKAISPLIIEMLSDRNSGVLNDRGQQHRKEAAIVMASTLGTNMREQGAGGDLESVTVDTIEDDTPNARTRQAMTNTDRIQEKTIVTPEGKAPRNPDAPRQQQNKGSKGRRS